MIATLISLLPKIIGVLFFIVLTWIISRMWYTTRYIHRDEVRPIQESQHIMQNQYAILAERIKHSESQLAETKAKLETALLAKEEALQRIVELELSNTNSNIHQNDLDKWSMRLLQEIKTTFSETILTSQLVDDPEKPKNREQFNLLKQSIKEFKTDFTQKLNSHTAQYHELSNQMWQLLEINKKLSTEAEALNKLIQNSEINNPDDKSTERQFTLTSIKKRS